VKLCLYPEKIIRRLFTNKSLLLQSRYIYTNFFITLSIGVVGNKRIFNLKLKTGRDEKFNGH
jgi:predicted glycosyltransferase involved in capsule biosynthesis